MKENKINPPSKEVQEMLDFAKANKERLEKAQKVLDSLKHQTNLIYTSN